MVSRRLVTRFKLLIALWCCCEPVSAQCNVGHVTEMIRLAAAAMQSDWTRAPEFAFVERDAERSKGISKVRTHRVFMIQGSDYYLPVADNDIPLALPEQDREWHNLALEVVRRSRETQKERKHRCEHYQKEREQTGVLLLEFVKAFDFVLVGEETVHGHRTCVMDAKPRRRYRPPNRQAKVLTGMQGRLWIENQHFHWVKAEAEVLKPVSIVGFLAKVLPGTRMDLEMAPVSDSVWLVSSFAVTVKSSVFWKVSERLSERTYSKYRLAPVALGELESLRDLPEPTVSVRP